MEKLIRGLIVGVVLSCASLVGLGWRAYGKMNDMGEHIKKEVKEEMVEIRNRDMEYINSRFNTLEVIMVGRVVTPPRKEK